MPDDNPASNTPQTIYSARIDMIREATRNVIGLSVIGAVLYMFFRFVEMTPDQDRDKIMLLVIGYLGGLITGVSTWYFGGAMRSALEQALRGKPGEPATPIATPAMAAKKPPEEEEAVG